MLLAEKKSDTRRGMAKGKTEDERSYQSDKSVKPLTPAEIRKWAEDLRLLARDLDKQANYMDFLKCGSITMFKETVPGAIRTARNWVSSQLLTRIAKVSAEFNVRVDLKLDAFEAWLEEEEKKKSIK